MKLGFKNKNKTRDNGVEKNKGKFLYSKFERSTEPPVIILFLIKRCYIKNEKMAVLATVLIVLCLIIISLNMFVHAFSAPTFIGNI